MNDPFASGPLVFRPRDNAKAINIGAIAFFLFFIALCWGLVPFGGERGRGFFVGFAIFGTLAFGSFLLMFLAAMRDTREPIELTSEGIRAGGRFLRWDDVRSAEEEMRTDKVVVVRSQGAKPLVLRITHYEDGAEMGRLVRAQVKPEEWTGAEKIYRLKGRLTTTLVGGFYIAALVATAWAQWDAPMRSTAMLHPRWIPLLLVPPLVYGLIEVWTHVVRLTSSTLTVGAFFRRRSIPLSAIDSVQEAGTHLNVRSGSRKVKVRSSFEGYLEIRERLRACVPKAVSRVSSGAAVTRPDTAVYCFPAKRFAWLGPLLMGIFILSFALPGEVMGLAMVPQRAGAGFALAGISLVPTLLGFWGIFYAVEARTGYVLDQEGIERKAIFRSKRLRWRDVEGAWREGSTLSGIHLKTASDALEVSPEFVQDGEALISAIEERVQEAKARAVRTAEGESFGASGEWKSMAGFLGLVGLLFLGGCVPAFNGSMGRGRPGDDVGGILMGCLFGGMGLLLVGLAVSSAFGRYVPTAEGLDVVTLRGRRFVPWREFTRAESSVQRGKSTRVTLTLEHPQGAVRINTATTREFDRLRGAVFARVDAGIVRSEEPD